MAHHDAVEVALAVALERASSAEQWDVVANLSRELSERRRAREAPEVASLDRVRTSRRKSL